MDYTEIITLVIKLAALVLSILIVRLVPKVKSWLDTQLNENQWKQIIEYTTLFVEAAEQLLKDCDPDGLKRKEYVVQQLNAIGIQVTDQINAIIESKVLELNKKQ